MLLGREKNSPAWEVVGMRESPPDTCLGGRRSLLPGRGSFAPDACLGRDSYWLQSPGRVREARISLSCLYHGAKARQAGDLLILIFTGKALCLSGGRQPADSREPEVKSNLMMRKTFAGDLLILIFKGKARCLSGGRQPADSREPEVKTNLLMRINFARSAKAITLIRHIHGGVRFLRATSCWAGSERLCRGRGGFVKTNSQLRCFILCGLPDFHIQIFR